MKFIMILTGMNGRHKVPSIDCDLIIGDCDMPAGFVWDEGCAFTEYGIKKYEALLNSECHRLENGNMRIDYDDENVGEAFCWECAGYGSATEYDKVFKKA